MKRALALVALALSGCASRMSFPGADPSDVIACRDYASGFGAARVNGEFNACMQEAGYKPATAAPVAPQKPQKPRKRWQH